MLATEITTALPSSPARQADTSEAESSVTTVKVYTRHNRGCPRRDRPDWARCNCVKWLYVYRNGKDTLTSAKMRSWEKAEQKARVAKSPVRQRDTSQLFFLEWPQQAQERSIELGKIFTNERSRGEVVRW